MLFVFRFQLLVDVRTAGFPVKIGYRSSEPLPRAEEPEADAVGDDDADGDRRIVERLGVDGLRGGVS